MATLEGISKQTSKLHKFLYMNVNEILNMYVDVEFKLTIGIRLVQIVTFNVIF